MIDKNKKNAEEEATLGNATPTPEEQLMRRQSAPASFSVASVPDRTSVPQTQV